MTLSSLSRFTIEPERLAPWVTRLLLFLAGVSLAHLTWTLWPLPEEVLPPVLPNKLLPTETTSVSLESVGTLHLFGEPMVAEIAPPDAPETRLALTLRGLYVSNTPEFSRAIIVDSSGKETLYGVDDIMPCGAVLKEIHHDHVHLLRAGHYETLRLLKDDLPAGSKVAATSTSERLGALRSRLMRNPQDVWSLALVQPVMKDGHVHGYKVIPKQQQQLFSQAGLISGDVVLSVNGVSASDAANMGKLLNELASANRLDLSVERGGQQHTVTLVLD